MLTQREVRDHERKLWRLVAWEAIAFAVCAGGLALGENRLREFVLPVGGVWLVVAWFRLWGYMFRDLKLRGRSPVWAWVLGGGSGFVLWGLWRRWHPVPTRENPVARVDSGRGAV
jgi:hypothetical protein